MIKNRRPWLYSEFLLFFYVVSVVTLSASVGIHKISNLIGIVMVGVFFAELIIRHKFSLSQFKIKPFLPLVFLLLIQVIWLMPNPGVSDRVKTFAQIILLMILSI